MATTLTAFRRELAYRALRHARIHPHETTHGSLPSIVFKPYQLTAEEGSESLHGNFHPASWRAILANPAWSARLTKSYSAASRIPHRHHPDRDRTRRELDCAVSSDALLMNIFCHPGVLTRPAVQALLGLASDQDSSPQPVFGYKPRLPLGTGQRNRPLVDRTEIDLHLGPLLIEAKLTETGFQRAPLARIQRYPAFTEVFSLDDLIHAEDLSITAEAGSSAQIDSYQLIRGVLAAHHEDRGFVVLCDARRADLIERWFHVLRAVQSSTLRSRCALLTWQELAATLPATLQQFLDEKYGILPA